MARTHILRRLPNLIIKMRKKKEQQITDSEEKADASKDRFRVREGLRSALEWTSVDTASFLRTHRAGSIFKSRGN